MQFSNARQRAALRRRDALRRRLPRLYPLLRRLPGRLFGAGAALVGSIAVVGALAWAAVILSVLC